MNRMDQVLAAGRKLFIPYVTAGHPSLAATVPVLQALVAAGADILELGYPFSDPTADGPVIQVSSQTALAGGMTQAAYFAALRQFRAADARTPVVIFSYYNPIFHTGAAQFAAAAREAGADALLVVDLPFEEQGELRPHLDREGLHLIQLIAPTTPEERARRILANATGFVYQIALRGVTGVRTELATDAAENAARTRRLTRLPVAMGFGVATAAQARAVAAAADGVIVGSAIVKCLQDHSPNYMEPLRALAVELAQATHGTGGPSRRA